MDRTAYPCVGVGLVLPSMFGFINHLIEFGSALPNEASTEKDGTSIY
jgi:hypothetical protein